MYLPSSPSSSTVVSVSFNVSRIRLDRFLIHLGEKRFEEFEQHHDKTNEVACAPSEDSDQPVYPPSLNSLRCPHKKSLSPYLHIERTAKTLIRLGGCPG